MVLMFAVAGSASAKLIRVSLMQGVALVALRTVGAAAWVAARLAPLKSEKARTALLDCET